MVRSSTLWCWGVFLSLIMCSVPRVILAYPQSSAATRADEKGQGIKLYQQGNINEAIEALRKAVKENKQDYEAWHFLGLALINQKNLKEASKSFEAALKLQRSDTMWLYSQPVSSPDSRTVFGAKEVDKRARLIDAPAAVYPDAARNAKAKGEVRLRMVLAGDGTVKYIFPMKPLKYDLTEAAMEAARHIKFGPAIRDGQPVSQFETLSYEFKNGRGLTPYVPEHEFYF